MAPTRTLDRARDISTEINIAATAEDCQPHAFADVENRATHRPTPETACRLGRSGPWLGHGNPRQEATPRQRQVCATGRSRAERARWYASRRFRTANPGRIARSTEETPFRTEATQGGPSRAPARTRRAARPFGPRRRSKTRSAARRRAGLTPAREASTNGCPPNGRGRPRPPSSPSP